MDHEGSRLPLEEPLHQFRRLRERGDQTPGRRDAFHQGFRTTEVPKQRLLIRGGFFGLLHPTFKGLG
jgi:hypothetical protein